MKPGIVSLIGSTLALTACSQPAQVPESNRPTPLPTDGIAQATFDDVADAAIWTDTRHNGRHWLIGTLEDDGLGIFDATGRLIWHSDEQPTQGADLRNAVAIDDKTTLDLLAVGLPNHEAIGFFRVTGDENRPLLSLGRLPLTFEPETVCLYDNITTGQITATGVSGDGHVLQYRLTVAGDAVSSAVTTEAGEPKAVREFQVGGELSACIVDDQTATLFLAEEEVGIWAYGADAENVKARRLVDGVAPFGHLEEIEGLDLVYMENKAGFLIAGDEGTGFHLYGRAGNYDYLGSLPVAGFEEAKSLAASSDVLWLANSGLEEPRYEWINMNRVTDHISRQGYQTHPTVNRTQLSLPDLSKVPATGETTDVDDEGDAADDPAIWVHPTDASQSLILGTNKQGGLMAYDLAGNELQYLEGGEPNNIDIRQTVSLESGGTLSLMAASNRDLNTIALYRVQAATGAREPIQPLQAIGDNAHAEAPEFASNVDEIYGLCLYQAADGTPYVFVNGKDGEVEQWRLTLSEAGVRGQVVRQLNVPSQPEGCVADDATGQLYLGEEDVGVWRFQADENATSDGELFLKVDDEQLVADVEGLALYDNGENKYLIVSSQGNNTYAVYDVNRSHAYVGRFAVIGNDKTKVDGASDTDGIEVVAANLGPTYPTGLFVAQDWYNVDAQYEVENQNFKLVSWQTIANTLQLK